VDISTGAKEKFTRVRAPRVRQPSRVERFKRVSVQDNKTNNGTKTKLSDVIYERELELIRLKDLRHRLDVHGIPYESLKISYEEGNLNGAYFRMGLVVGLVVAILGVYFTYEIMS
jgi:hypothetical protein